MAAKATGKALLRTPAGKQATRELEKMMNLDKLPKPIQQIGPIITIFVDKKITYKWEF